MSASLCPEHPDTTVSAWNLFQTLVSMKASDAAGRLLQEHLLWLLDPDRELVEAQQQQVRDMLASMMREGSQGGGE
ncbi:MAG: hypothetical protein AAF212_04010 [Verrucomicrobiota bacterium]